MKKERSIIIKIIYLLLEVVIGGSIFAAILAAFIGDTTLVRVIVLLISYSLFTFLGIAYMKRKWVMKSSDGLILGIVTGIVVFGIAYVNIEHILYSIIVGAVIGGLIIFLLKKDVPATNTNTNFPR